jgi:predicted GIY-YIG superfamily endonuclease
MKLFGTTYVVRKDEKLLYRGKDATQAARIASGNAQNGSAYVYQKRGSKEILWKEYGRAEWDRTHRQADTPPEPATDAP